MNHKLISCVLIIVCIALIMMLIWIRIPKHSEREYAGYFKKDALTKGCGWLSNIIWATYFDGFGWMIYSKSGYVTDDRNTVDYNESTDADIHDSGYECPELIRGNHASDIQPFWREVTSYINDAGNPYIALPCVFTFQANFAGVIEGCMHAATGFWASTHSDELMIARYGAPGVILGNPHPLIWLTPNKIKGKDFKAKNFQWESPHGEMMAFGPISDLERTKALMDELRSTILYALVAAREDLLDTIIMQYPDDSATKLAYMAAVENRNNVEPCGVDIHADEPAVMELSDLLGTIALEAGDAAHNAVQIALSADLDAGTIASSVYMIGNASMTLFGQINETTVSDVIRGVRAIDQVIDNGFDPSELFTAYDVGNDEYVTAALQSGIDVDEFIAAVSFLSRLPNAMDFIMNVKPCMIFFNELQELLNDVFSDPLTKTALWNNVGDFRTECIDVIANEFISPFVDSIGEEEGETMRTVVNSVIMTNMAAVIENGSVLVQ